MLNDTNNNLERVYAQMAGSYSLPVVSLEDLYDMSIMPKRQIIEDLLSQGVFLLAGAPKVGKSFMVGQIAVHVATGTPLWGRSVEKGAVLYLALEDTCERLQRRFYRMFGEIETQELFFSLVLNEGGVEDQLTQFINSHPNSKLVIIDTLARTRNETKAQSYLGDYKEIANLKTFADEHYIAILLVHHTRKQPATDGFEMINGTTGILGAVDGALLLRKKDRTSNDATLEVTGRDYPDQLLKLRRDTNTLCWSLISEKRDLWKPEPDPVLEKISNLLSKGESYWHGSPQELVDVLLLDMLPNRLTRYLNTSAQRLLDEYQIIYTNRPLHEGRRITLMRENINTQSSDGRNDCDDSNDCVR